MGCSNTLTPNDAHLGDIESVLFSGVFTGKSDVQETWFRHISECAGNMFPALLHVQEDFQ